MFIHSILYNVSRSKSIFNQYFFIDFSTKAFMKFSQVLNKQRQLLNISCLCFISPKLCQSNHIQCCREGHCSLFKTSWTFSTRTSWLCEIEIKGIIWPLVKSIFSENKFFQPVHDSRYCTYDLFIHTTRKHLFWHTQTASLKI